MDLQFQSSFIMPPFMMGMLGPGLPALLPIAGLPLAVVSISRVEMASLGLVNLLLMPESLLHATWYGLPEFSTPSYQERREGEAEHLGRDIGKLHYGKGDELFLL